MKITFTRYMVRYRGGKFAAVGGKYNKTKDPKKVRLFTQEGHAKNHLNAVGRGGAIIPVTCTAELP